LNPASYIFYREYANGDVRKYDFKEIELKKNAFVVFDVNGKLVRRRLKHIKNGMCCNSPTGSGIVYPVRRDKIEDILKNICEKCEMLENLQHCSVLNGNCGIPTCQRIRTAPTSIYNITSFRYVHHHELCKRCFDGISKSRSFTFNITNSYPNERRSIKIIN